jgi:hypothetical protein
VIGYMNPRKVPTFPTFLVRIRESHGFVPKQKARTKVLAFLSV